MSQQEIWDRLHDELDGVQRLDPGFDEVESRAAAYRRRRARRRTAVVGVAAVVVAGGAVMLWGGAGPEPDSNRPEAISGEPTTRSGPVGSDTSTSCVSDSTPTEVMRRGFAFDGIVDSVKAPTDGGPWQVTFAVEEWFRDGGSRPARFTVEMMSPDAGKAEHGMSESWQPAYQRGTRLLVSGENVAGSPVAWRCNFTRYWTVEDLASWRAAAH